MAMESDKKYVDLRKPKEYDPCLKPLIPTSKEYISLKPARRVSEDELRGLKPLKPTPKELKPLKPVSQVLRPLGRPVKVAVSEEIQTPTLFSSNAGKDPSLSSIRRNYHSLAAWAKHSLEEGFSNGGYMYGGLPIEGENVSDYLYVVNMPDRECLKYYVNEIQAGNHRAVSDAENLFLKNRYKLKYFEKGLDNFPQWYHGFVRDTSVRFLIEQCILKVKFGDGINTPFTERLFEAHLFPPGTDYAEYRWNIAKRLSLPGWPTDVLLVDNQDGVWDRIGEGRDVFDHISLCSTGSGEKHLLDAEIILNNEHILHNEFSGREDIPFEFIRDPFHYHYLCHANPIYVKQTPIHLDPFISHYRRTRLGVASGIPPNDTWQRILTCAAGELGKAFSSKYGACPIPS